MPSEAIHIAQACRNQETIDYLLTGPMEFPEWVATVAFYKALHVVEAVLSHNPERPHTQTHEMRERVLKTTPKYGHIYKHYAVLKRTSLIARYLSADDGAPVPSFAAYMPLNDVRREILHHRLRQLERSARGMLSRAAAQTLLPPPST